MFKRIKFSKRQRFSASALILSVGLLLLQWVPLDYRYLGILLLGFITYGMSAFALLEDLKGIEWFTILVLPTMYAVSISLFYFLLPEGFLSRLLIVSLFGVGMYTLFLTENIFSVAAARTIQLVRAAHAVGFLMTLLTLMLFYNTLFSLHWPFYLNGLGAFLVTLPAFIQGLWFIKLENKLDTALVKMSVGISYAIALLAIGLSFIPVTVWVASLFLATAVYVGLGLLQHALNDRLFEQTMYEYVGVGAFVFIATLVVTQWK